MPSFLERLLKSRKTPPSAEDFRRMQSDAEREVEAAAAAREAAQRSYDDSLLDADASATKTARARLIDAEDDHNRATARVAAIRTEFLRACEEEAEADRRAQYERALEMTKKARAAFRRYEKAAHDIRAAIGEIAGAEVEIRRANADLPEGVDPIVGLEQQVRGLPSTPARTIEENAEALWVYRDWHEVAVEPERIAKIESSDGVTGQFTWEDWADSRTYRVIKRRRITRRIQPGVSSFTPTPLHAAVALPGLTPNSSPIFSPTPDPRFSLVGPRDVVAHVAALEQAAENSPADPRGTPSTPDTIVEWEDINPDDQAELDAAMAAAGGAM